MSRVAADTRTDRRATIADVAAAIGVTKGTVSRALNGHPDISPGTRVRAAAAAARLGYRPLGSAQAIRTGRCRAIGLVIETGEHDAHRPFLSEFLAGLSEGAAAEGWSLTVAATTDGGSEGGQAGDPAGGALATYRRLIEECKADGFVLPRTRSDDERVNMLREAGVPFVLFGRHDDPAGCAWYDIDGAQAMRESVARLVADGHRRIAFIGGSAAHAYSHLRERGYRDGMADAGLDVAEDRVAHGALERDAGEAIAGAMLDREGAPTAFVFAIDRAALGLWRAARARGLVVGRELAVIGYDGTPEAAHAEPPLATWAVDYRAAGLRLAALLMRRVRGEPADALREITSATYLDRGSARARAHRPE